MLKRCGVKIVDFMMTMGKFDRKDVESILDVSPATAKRLIQSLIKTRLIKQERMGSKDIFYMLNI